MLKKVFFSLLLGTYISATPIECFGTTDITYIDDKNAESHNIICTGDVNFELDQKLVADSTQHLRPHLECLQRQTNAKTLHPYQQPLQNAGALRLLHSQRLKKINLLK